MLGQIQLQIAKIVAVLAEAADFALAGGTTLIARGDVRRRRVIGGVAQAMLRVEPEKPLEHVPDGDLYLCAGWCAPRMRRH